jgi:flagellin
VATGASEILASQDSYFSSVRLKLGQMIGGGAPGSNVTINIDLVDFGTNVSMSLAFTSAHLASGAAFASELQDKLQSAVSAMSIIVDGNSVGGTHIGSTFTVDYLSETNEILIRDSGGRAFHFGIDNASNFAVGNAIFDGAFNGNASANTAEINQTAEIVAKGEVTDQTRATLAFNQDNATGINFSLDGVALSAATDFVFGVDTFVGSTLESRLDALMEDLNATENGEPYAYVFDAATRSITFIQKDAREIEISGFVSTEDTLAASWTPHAGQGAATTLNYVEATTSASAEGLGATATEVTMTLGGDDLYSMVISNGSSDYTLSATVLDISDATSRSNFQSALETALTGSGISVAINSIGALSFTDASGGEISLKSFGSVNGNTGTWTPASGQGDAYVADGSGSINSSTTVTASSSSSSSSGSSVDQINIATQEGAQDAISVIDAAIAYILAERSGLGAIENRLGHTIDNLSNIVVNTEAAKSRILDADFSAETSQLTKLQILQQAATAMLAQANQSKQSVLSLLQG